MERARSIVESESSFEMVWCSCCSPVQRFQAAVVIVAAVTSCWEAGSTYLDYAAIDHTQPHISWGSVLLPHLFGVLMFRSSCWGALQTCSNCHSEPK